MAKPKAPIIIRAFIVLATLVSVCHANDCFASTLDGYILYETDCCACPGVCVRVSGLYVYSLFRARARSMRDR